MLGWKASTDPLPPRRVGLSHEADWVVRLGLMESVRPAEEAYKRTDSLAGGKSSQAKANATSPTKTKPLGKGPDTKITNIIGAGVRKP